MPPNLLPDNFHFAVLVRRFAIPHLEAVFCVAGDDVHVRMEDDLPRARLVVHRDIQAISFHARLHGARDSPRGFCDTRKVFGQYVENVARVHLRYDERMTVIVRADIKERENVFVFENFLRRYFAIYYFAEKAVGHRSAVTNAT